MATANSGACGAGGVDARCVDVGGVHASVIVGVFPCGRPESPLDGSKRCAPHPELSIHWREVACTSRVGHPRVEVRPVSYILVDDDKLLAPASIDVGRSLRAGFGVFPTVVGAISQRLCILQNTGIVATLFLI